MSSDGASAGKAFAGIALGLVLLIGVRACDGSEGEQERAARIAADPTRTDEWREYERLRDESSRILKAMDRGWAFAGTIPGEAAKLRQQGSDFLDARSKKVTLTVEHRRALEGRLEEISSRVKAIHAELKKRGYNVMQFEADPRVFDK